MKQIAIIGATASGKSQYAINLAKKINAYILSLDSLSIYKEIDIISAKPSKQELLEVKHFGIDEIYPNQHFNAADFIKLYKKAKKKAKKDDKNLIIVGGSSFYLKAILDGLSSEPIFSQNTLKKTNELLQNLQKAHKFLQKIDFELSKKISQNDKYRLAKALSIYFETNMPPSLFRQKNKKIPKQKIKIFELVISKEKLKENIFKRTQKMIKNGAIDEVAFLEHKYSRDQKPFNSIGIKEIFDYFDGKLTKDELISLISIHTIQLAKRQTTFNKTQFIHKNEIRL